MGDVDRPTTSGDVQADGSSSFDQQAVTPNIPSVTTIFHVKECHEVDVRPNGLWLPDGLPFDSWRELGHQVTRVMNYSAWWLGDWLVYGERTYRDRYRQAITETSLNYQTLRNYAWVSRTFLVSRRRDKLSFGHHIEVAALPEDQQEAWLTRAEQLNWSCNKLRRTLRAASLANRRDSGDDEAVQTRALKIDVPIDRHDRWQAAAERQDRTMGDWIIAALDRVASEELGSGRIGADQPPASLPYSRHPHVEQ